MARLTTEDFVRRSKAMYGDKYDYSKTVFAGLRTKLTIVCPEHGEFYQTPRMHFEGKMGCKGCREAMGVRTSGLTKTTEQYLKEVRAVHGDKYDYSQVVYTGAHKEVKIGCPEHGLFLQRANVHLKGHHCPQCGWGMGGKKTRGTLSVFLKEANKVHGDRFDYSRVKWQGNGKKVEIGCPEHGYFMQSPARHIEGKGGCPECKYTLIGKAKRTLQEDFISRANVVHDSKYDYSGVVYKTAKDKVKIVCRVHGAFEQEANSHLDGCGCPKCADEARAEKARLSTEEFVQRAREVHGDKYDYSQVVYKRGRDKVKIVCPIHGPFWQAAESHTAGCGCPKCRNGSFADNLNRLRNETAWADSPCYVYIARINGAYLKPGISNNVVTRERLSDGFYKGYDFVSPTLTRAEAWAVEQCLHVLSQDAEPATLPKEYDGWGGATELRLKDVYPATWYIAKYHELVEELAEIGWEELYLKYQEQTLN